MKKILSTLLIAATFGSFIVSPSSLTPATHATTFSPGNLIGDSLFTAKDSMTVNDIQRFLEQRGSVLAVIQSSFLGDNAGGRSAAQIIFDASRQTISGFGGSNTPNGSGNPYTISLNPQVILATLQKETSLITANYTIGSASLNNVLRIAMGYGCPDGGGCNPIYAGFTNQVTFGAAQLWLDLWRAQNGTPGGFAVGSTQTLNNNPVYAPYCPTGGSITFTVANAATSSLYRYTPHVCNGNANFWFFINSWFIPKPLTFTLALDTDGTVYAIRESKRYAVSGRGFVAWGFSGRTVPAMTNEQRALPYDGVLSNLVLYEDGTVFLIENGYKRVLTDPSLVDGNGLRWSDVQPLSTGFIDQIPFGLPLHALVLPTGDGTIFMTTNSTRYPMTAAIFRAWNYPMSRAGRVPAYVTAEFAIGPLLTNLAVGMTGDGTVYLVDRGIAYAVSASAATGWGLDLSQTRRVGNNLINEQVNGGTLTNLARSASGDGTIFLMSGGTRRPISGAAWRRNGYNGADVRVISEEFLSTIPLGSTLR